MAELSFRVASRVMMMTRRRRALVGLWLATFLLLCAPALLGTTAGASFAATKLAAAKGEVACPSREFSNFMDAFSEDARLQRRFTRFPLEYTYLDASLIGTKEEDAALKKQMVGSFEATPFRFGKGQSAGLFPSRLERRKMRLATKLVPPETGEPSPDNKNVMLFEPDTGNINYYRFRRERGCWYLYVIDSRSL